MFGDGAAAVIVGAVSEGRGILGASRFTDGRYPRTLIASVPGGHWYDDGRSMLHLADPIAAREVPDETVDLASGAIGGAGDAGLAAADVTVHRSTRARRGCASRLRSGGYRACAFDRHHASTGYLFAALIPLESSRRDRREAARRR